MLSALLLLLATSSGFFPSCLGYVELSSIRAPREVMYSRDPVPRPHQVPADLTTTAPTHSFITAIAPSMTLEGNASFGAIYSIGYREFFGREAFGRGVFARGVFASDPPGTTCTPCGVVASTTSQSATPSITCSSGYYGGVFRSSVGGSSSSTAAYCFASSYDGVFSTSVSTIPCCFTIPSSCLASYNTSSTAYTGVFRSSTVTSTIASKTTSSPSPSRTTSSNSLKSSQETSSAGSTTARHSSSPDSGSAPSLSSFTSQVLTPITSIIVISSTTITITTSVSLVLPSSSLPSSSVTISSSMTSLGTTIPIIAQGNGTVTGFGTIIGVGVASGLQYRDVPQTFIGSGVATGTGTAIGYGTAKGYGTVIGSGTANGTGTFIGSATAIGSGTIIGTATVLVGGSIPVVSSGTITGSGTAIGIGTIYGYSSFIGSGTFIGSPGTFVGTGIATTMGISFSIPTIKTPSSGGTTVTIFIEDCAPTAVGMPRVVINGTASSPTSFPTLDNVSTDPLCHVCANDAAICCPRDVYCSAGGHCPWGAMERAGFVRFGFNIVAAGNRTS